MTHQESQKLRLLYAPTSPFVRKVMVCAHLLDVARHIELLDSAAHPVYRDPRIGVHNPLAQVPTLILPEGRELYDSRVICEYLAERSGDGRLFPDGKARWRALRLQSLGDGLLDAALLARYEYTARPEHERSGAWRAAQLGKVAACLDVMEVEADSLAVTAPSIGEVTLACALGYLDFRFPELDWRSGHAVLADWFEAFEALPALRDTFPHEA